MKMHVMILGTRGVPANYGGFETFAQDLSLYLVDHGHKVTVYGQAGEHEELREDDWNGVHRVLIPAPNSPLGTIQFDWAATRHSARQSGVVLTMGYNTGIFSLLYWLRRMPNAMNMDGMEWKRQKWSRWQKAWLWCNQWASAWIVDQMIADHGEIARYLATHAPAQKIVTIPYGADEVTSASSAVLEQFSLTSKGYYILIARSEPENSILEIVQAFSALPQCAPLIVLGDYSDTSKKKPSAYRQRVKAAAGSNVRFLGAIHDREIVHSLRFHAKAYVHGHRVGGTNPSLVESLAAGNAVIAHDNPYTRWVAGEGAMFFKSTEDLMQTISLLECNHERLAAMEKASRLRHREDFTQDKVLPKYEALLLQLAHANAGSRAAAMLVPKNQA